MDVGGEDLVVLTLDFLARDVVAGVAMAVHTVVVSVLRAKYEQGLLEGIHIGLVAAPLVS
jgi:hypothetical protein